METCLRVGDGEGGRVDIMLSPNLVVSQKITPAIQAPLAWSGEQGVYGDWAYTVGTASCMHTHRYTHMHTHTINPRTDT